MGHHSRFYMVPKVEPFCARQVSTLSLGPCSKLQSINASSRCSLAFFRETPVGREMFIWFGLALRQCSIYGPVFWNSLYNPGWPQTPKDLPASASQVLCRDSRHVPPRPMSTLFFETGLLTELEAHWFD